MARIVVREGRAPLGTYDPNGLRLPSFVALRPAFEAGSDSPRAFLERCLERVARREPEVRAFAHLAPDKARAAADAATRRYREGRPLSPIDGCPIAFKDSIETVDMPTQLGSAAFAGWMSGRDAACVHALRQGGAAILGKTHVPELVLGASPPTRNPFDAARTPGGSSSGSGAAVGAGMVPVAIGNQTGGSLIRPASYCGAYGFKPTFGALNIGGMHPLAPSQDHIGPLAATLADAWLAAQQIAARVGGSGGHPGLAGEPALPPPVRPRRLVRLRTTGWSELDGGTIEAFERLIGEIARAGVEIVGAENDRETARLEGMLSDAHELSNDILLYETRWPILAYRDSRPAGAIGAGVLARMRRAIQMTRDDYVHALAKRDEIRRQVETAAAASDGFLTLASSGPAPLGLEHTGSRRFQSPWSMVGGPSLSLPLLAVNGLPVGVQLMGLPDADGRLVAVADWIDRLFGA